MSVLGRSKIFKSQFLRFNKKPQSNFESVASVDLIFIEKLIKSCGQVGHMDILALTENHILANFDVKIFSKSKFSFPGN